MRAFELLAVVYYVALAATSRSSRAGVKAKRRAMRLAILMAGLVIAAAYLLPWPVRVWVPLVYLAAGYWVPAGLLPQTPDRVFEAWLVQTDAQWRVRAFSPPAIIRPLLELAYLGCFVLVPVAFGVVWRAGTEPDVERFWLAVLLSGFACYATVPWLAARPPRLLESERPRPSGLAAFTDRLLARVSHRMTTFPSGHVAVAVAAALAVAPVSATAATALGVVSAGIAAGAVAGRYHFAVDVVLGAVVGAVAALVSSTGSPAS